MNAPKISKREVEQILERHGVNLAEKEVCIVGIRGYRKRTMGAPDRNDRGIYDDAICVIAADGSFRSFNANTDPSVYRKGIATLKPGIYEVVRHKHKGCYDALQIVCDTVNRDGQSGDDVGRHGINIHYGGERQTWSEGCQTLPKSSYWNFLRLVYGLMDKFGLTKITYLLIEY